MKNLVFLIVVCCLVLGAQPAAAKHTPPAKHAAAKKNPEKAPERHESAPGETVEAPGRVIKEPNAFNGIKWGTGMAAIPDLSVAERDGQAAYATAQGVVYRIGDAFLSGVVYGFCQDKFAAVMVDYKGKKNHESIKNFLVAKYSKPIDLEGNGYDVGWPVGNVLIRMNYSPATDAGTLSYFYQPLYGPCGEAKAAQ
ncbi:hypothetical protein [Desulfovibrio sp. TomC]|uniref:hypothetical protein n=1 Tax=Desulfovibrio sp. TomC TaxID=1562888 RepID=UPI0005752E91|nr:hypothetical protein [Desulfovibrio sp. TomC]KHK01945.1 Peptidoglycan-binding LysM [Desulfovibrio sp. TomC]